MYKKEKNKKISSGAKINITVNADGNSEVIVSSEEKLGKKNVL